MCTAAIFLEVEINVGGIQLAGSTLSQRRANSGVDTVDALLSLRKRTLSYTAPAAADGLGCGAHAVSLHDFHLIKVLGKGRYVLVYASPLFFVFLSVCAIRFDPCGKCS